eukprot:TRINITY_DN3815_c1_g1_i1.p1 TRINITY_DN3815_c1_g1~~TRINITY_DN3815_c1_g1_i1.p1  ORF type:complete len:351 (+),score=56.58 TRINITY_DN3815_c1_g1_i1:162-1214(+)
MKTFTLLFKLFALLSLFQNAFGDKAFRSVSVYSNSAADLVVVDMKRWGIYHNEQSEGVLVDLVRLIVSNSIIGYSNFVGDKNIQSPGNSQVTDISTASFAFFLRFEILVEYLETNGVPGFQQGEDTVLSSYELFPKTVNWNIDAQTTNYTFDDGTVGKMHNLTYSTQDNVFDFVLSSVGRPFRANNVLVDENSVKLAFNIRYYNYNKASSNPNAQIALAITTAHRLGSTNLYNNASNSFNVMSNNYTGFINFENAADTLDFLAVHRSSNVIFDFQAGLDVEGSMWQNWGASAIILSYNQTRPQLISHDPVMGSQIPDTPANEDSSSMGFVSSKISLAMLFALSALLLALL